MIIPRTRAIVFRTDTSLACVARRSSKKEHRVNALALGADERRGKLRKASGRRKQPSIRRFLNGETYLSKPQVSIRESIAYGRERCELKHLSSNRRRKKNRFPKQRRAKGKEAKPKDLVLRGCGLHQAMEAMVVELFWESRPKTVKVRQTKPEDPLQDPEYHGTRETLWEAGGTTPQA